MGIDDSTPFILYGMSAVALAVLAWLIWRDRH